MHTNTVTAFFRFFVPRSCLFLLEATSTTSKGILCNLRAHTHTGRTSAFHFKKWTKQKKGNNFFSLAKNCLWIYMSWWSFSPSSFLSFFLWSLFIHCSFVFSFEFFHEATSLHSVFVCVDDSTELLLLSLVGGLWKLVLHTYTHTNIQTNL